MQQKNYKVSNKHPLPKHTGRGRQPIYNFPELEVGQSIFVDSDNECKAARSQFNRRRQNLCIRPEGDGYRVWRVK